MIGGHLSYPHNEPSDAVYFSFLFLSVLIFFAAIAYSGYLVQSYVCASRWEKSGMRTDYGPVQGCLIEHEGRWVPEQNYREIP